MKFSRFWIVCAVLACAGTFTWAQETSQGISVSGTGTVKAKPSVVEIGATITADAELAADANVKFRDARKKAMATIDAMKNPDLSVESQGVFLTEATDANAQMQMMRGMTPDTSKQKVQVSESFRLILKNADKLDSEKLLETVLKLVDAGRDAGMQIGPPPPASYYELQIRQQRGENSALAILKIPDISSIQEDAYKQAIDDARSKAERIAKLSGVKLGGVLSVHDQGTMHVNSSINPYYEMMAETQNPAPGKEASGSNFAEIPITVHVQVQFGIEK